MRKKRVNPIAAICTSPSKSFEELTKNRRRTDEILISCVIIITSILHSHWEISWRHFLSYSVWNFQWENRESETEGQIEFLINRDREDRQWSWNCPSNPFGFVQNGQPATCLSNDSRNSKSPCRMGYKPA